MKNIIASQWTKTSKKLKQNQEQSRKQILEINLSVWEFFILLNRNLWDIRVIVCRIFKPIRIESLYACARHNISNWNSVWSQGGVKRSLPGECVKRNRYGQRTCMEESKRINEIISDYEAAISGRTIAKVEETLGRGWRRQLTEAQHKQNFESSVNSNRQPINKNGHVSCIKEWYSPIII